MAVQDLTPQLRTRLSRLEKWVGVFVTFATLLLLTGLAYYLHNTAQRKGWFVPKVRYQTSLADASGLKIGQPVMLMGFEVGEITRIEANGPYDYYNVTVDFVIRAPYHGYLWSDSRVRVAGLPFLGGRSLEVLKGRYGAPTVEEDKTPSGRKVPRRILIHAQVDKLKKQLLAAGESGDKAQDAIKQAVATNTAAYYAILTPNSVYWLEPDTAPSLSERLEGVVNTAEAALPNILGLTNQLNRILSNANEITLHLDGLLVGASPVVANLGAVTTNLNAITGTLRDTKGALGEWLLPTNIQQELVLLLPNVNTTITNVNTNLVSVVSNLNKSLENLAGITSNLHAQVQMNTNILSSISDAVVHTDDFIQGLKRHWLLRSAFKPKPTNAPPVRPAVSPKGASWR
ncbi:MAG: MCE family protein [Verrucomicrobia bacterium]|nr:MCE family protein [Verrucomicrobiota bacterium]